MVSIHILNNPVTSGNLSCGLKKVKHKYHQVIMDNVISYIGSADPGALWEVWSGRSGQVSVGRFVSAKTWTEIKISLIVVQNQKINTP